METSPEIARLQELNPVIHPRTRLAIMSFLIASREASFSEVKTELGLTDGNLNLHMKVLEDHDYVEVEKTFVARRPRTTYRITAAGHQAFQEYLAILEGLLGLRTAPAARRPRARKKRT